MLIKSTESHSNKVIFNPCTARLLNVRFFLLQNQTQSKQGFISTKYRIIERQLLRTCSSYQLLLADRKLVYRSCQKFPSSKVCTYIVMLCPCLFCYICQHSTQFVCNKCVHLGFSLVLEDLSMMWQLFIVKEFEIIASKLASFSPWHKIC